MCLWAEGLANSQFVESRSYKPTKGRLLGTSIMTSTIGEHLGIARSARRISQIVS